MTADLLPTLAEHRAGLVLLDEPARCPAVKYDGWGVVRCTKPAGHPPTGPRGDVFHSGSGYYIDEEGEPEVFGTAWRYLPELSA